MRPKAIAFLIREAGLDKKAEEPLILDLDKLTNVARYFVIFHGNSDRHVKAIAEHIVITLKEKGVPVFHQEGLAESLWILLDFGAVIVHVFYKDTREYYGLERLWGDAPRL
ncbi:MAG: ribosome silencing factor [Candidatus Omnitrophica bacterium]|nr:ribosome silencing factor [Candidatus Omnitrophota bacterium]